MNPVLAQLLLQDNEPEHNFGQAEKLIAQVAAQKYDLVLPSETIDFAWTHPDAFN